MMDCLVETISIISGMDEEEEDYDDYADDMNIIRTFVNNLTITYYSFQLKLNPLPKRVIQKQVYIFNCVLSNDFFQGAKGAKKDAVSAAPVAT
jgi:hypothetical protein